MNNERSKDARYTNYFQEIKWEGSLLLYVSTYIMAILYFGTIVQIICFMLKKSNKYIFPPLIVDVYLLIVLIIQIASMIFYHNQAVVLIGLYASAYLLYDVFVVSLAAIFISPLIHGGETAVYNYRRWLLTTILTAFQVVISFALIILHNGNAFSKTIDTPLTALYVSATTFTTLGYGDYTPSNPMATKIVLAELFFFALFLILKLPIAVATSKIKLNTKE